MAKKASPKKKAPAKKAAASAETAFDKVVKMIARSKNGVDTKTIMKKTGFDTKKVANIIYKAKKRGQIKTAKKGLYVKG